MNHVRDVPQAEFETAVVARSHEVPVVVDFWANWCAPCRMLGPILEREVEALGGRVELAKVDTDNAQALASRFEVQGIPAVMAFRKGAVVANFVGAKDAAFVRRWLSELAPSPSAQRLASATTAAELEALVEDGEVGTKAALRLAELHLAEGRAAEAQRFLEKIPPNSQEAAAAESLSRQAAFSAVALAFGGEDKARSSLEADPNDLEARYALACALAARGDFPQALEAFLSVVSRSRKFRDDGARKAMVTIFERLGSQHEVTRAFRRRLQVVL